MTSSYLISGTDRGVLQTGPVWQEDTTARCCRSLTLVHQPVDKVGVPKALSSLPTCTSSSTG